MDRGKSDRPRETSLSSDEFTGKYEKSGLVGRWLVERFFRATTELISQVAAPGDLVLEVGCGAGYSTQRLRPEFPHAEWLGLDIEMPLLVAAATRNPGVPFVQGSIHALPYPDQSADVVMAQEVLEHLDDPQSALLELRRVARKAVIISTPREPIWRGLNMMRLKYLGSLGNTPGHIQHWSSRQLRRLAAQHFLIQDCKQPLPWTILLLEP